MMGTEEERMKRLFDDTRRINNTYAPGTKVYDGVNKVFRDARVDDDPDAVTRVTDNDLDQFGQPAAVVLFEEIVEAAIHGGCCQAAHFAVRDNGDTYTLLPDGGRSFCVPGTPL